MNKKNIVDFQKALLTSTRYIGKETETSIEKITDSSNLQKESLVAINSEIINKIKILANHQKENYKYLITHALNHYLGLKSLRLRDAMMELEKENSTNKKD